jgi:hypothetical protein
MGIGFFYGVEPMADTETTHKTEFEEPPGTRGLMTAPAPALARTPRPALWADVPDEQWTTGAGSLLTASIR